MNAAVKQEVPACEREPELLVEDMPSIQAHASFQSVGELASVTRMPPAAARAEPETPSQVILRLSSDPNFSIEKLDRLVAMFREQEVDRQRQAFNKALREVQIELKPVVRNAENKQTKSWYATLDRIAEAAMPIVTGKGFSITWGVGANPPEGHYKVTAILAHDDGFERHYDADVPVDIAGIAGTVNKTRTHAFKSTTTYGRSILLGLMFNITTKGADDDGNAAGGKAPPQVVSQEQVETLQRRLVSLGVDIPKFYKNFAIEHLEELGVPQFTRAMQLLDQRESAARNRPASPRDQVRKQLQDSVARGGQ